MELGQAGLDLIKSFEEFRRSAYMPTPDDVPTIGWGHTDGVQMGDACTVEEAEEWLREDCQWAVEAVNRSYDGVVPLSQNQFDALVSLTFNIGKPRFLGSTLLRKLNLGDQVGAADEFVRWNKQHGTILRGLTRRRIAERDLFLAPDGAPLLS